MTRDSSIDPDLSGAAEVSGDAARAESARSGRAVLTRTGGVVAAMAAVGLVAGACSSDDSSSSASSATSHPAGHDASHDVHYKDGEYTAEGGYISPGGPQKVGVTVTLSNNVIKSVSVDTSQTKGPSLKYQGKFAGGIADVVVGKNIDDIDVHKVSGSSLTSGGFNEAIEKIKREAAG